MAVVIYYCDKIYKNRTRLITLKRLRGSYSRENITALFIEIIKEYGFEDRLEYFIADNVKSNDVCIDLIL